MSNKLYLKTPLLRARSLSRALGKEVYLKMEMLQPSGSFKNRGIGELVRFYHQEGKKGIIAASGGNAGLAAAFAARKLLMKAKVVIPKSTPDFMKKKIESEGAEVIVHGENWNKSQEYAAELLSDPTYGFVSPFNHPKIWEGHSTLMNEIQEKIPEPDAILLSVGGGGLLCGVAEGCDRLSWKSEIVAVETEGAASFYASMEQGEPVVLKELDTVASSLASKSVTPQALEWAKKRPIHPVTVTDASTLQSLVTFAEEERLLVEPACGAALAPLYEKAPYLDNYQSIVVILCGGNLVNQDLMQEWTGAT